MKKQKKLILLILDGWGISDDKKTSAIANANTPYYDYLIENYPNAKLITHGESVGLPKNQMGNSEVGHINIGAGRVVFQELAKINNDINNGTFKENQNGTFFQWHDSLALSVKSHLTFVELKNMGKLYIGEKMV